MNGQRRALFILIFFVPLLFSSCAEKKRQVTRSYYFWRSNGITGSERKFLKENQVKKLYVRLMDVDWNEVYGPVPVAKGYPGEVNQEVNYYDSLQMQIVPVVFITNKTFQRIDSSDVPLLAKRVVQKFLSSYKQRSWGISFQPSEIQIDCDWTESTRSRYFYFLQQVKWLLASPDVLISATIRLHQYKYPGKTGVPPVDRGMLMVYNLSDLRAYSSVNSIYDNDQAKKYFNSGKKYSLPLDIVLPAYSWCIIFRDQQFYQIENGLSEKDLNELSFLEKRKNGFYGVKQDTVFHDLFLRPGDEIKPETIDSQTLQEAARLAQKAVNADSFAVAFFELSDKEIINYDHETLENIYRSYY
ncbi:MAG TPA: hypothetical protein VFI06_06805 [Chitinophagaceae bacterium]|nr:hypothetical protein [Chitinophagaceae bacterium]